MKDKDYGIKEDLVLLERHYNAIMKETNPENKAEMIESLDKSLKEVIRKYGYKGGIWDFYSGKYQIILKSRFAISDEVQSLIETTKVFEREILSLESPEDRVEMLKDLKGRLEDMFYDYQQKGALNDANAINNIINRIDNEINMIRTKGSK